MSSEKINENVFCNIVINLIHFTTIFDDNVVETILQGHFNLDSEPLIVEIF